MKHEWICSYFGCNKKAKYKITSQTLAMSAPGFYGACEEHIKMYGVPNISYYYLLSIESI